MSPRHRRVPPYPVGPAAREQGARFWLRTAGVALVAVAFVGFFMTRAYLGSDRLVEREADHAEVLYRHEQHIER